MSQRRRSKPRPARANNDELWTLSPLGWLVVLLFIIIPLLIGLLIGAAWF